MCASGCLSRRRVKMRLKGRPGHEVGACACNQYGHHACFAFALFEETRKIGRACPVALPGRQRQGRAGLNVVLGYGRVKIRERKEPLNQDRVSNKAYTRAHSVVSFPPNHRNLLRCQDDFFMRQPRHQTHSNARDAFRRWCWGWGSLGRGLRVRRTRHETSQSLA